MTRTVTVVSQWTLPCLFLLTTCFAYAYDFDFPSPLKLRVGFVPETPFVMIKEKAGSNGGGGANPFSAVAGNGGNTDAPLPDDYEYTGLVVDLVHRLPAFAAMDNVTLELEIIRQDIVPLSFGAAFDMVSNDCVQKELSEHCDKVDMMASTFVVNPDRVMRAHLAPSILRTGVSLMKYKHDEGSTSPMDEVTTVAEAVVANATICVKKGSYTASAFLVALPHLSYYQCENGLEGCIEALQKRWCTLIAAPQLELLYHEAWDEEQRLHVTGEVSYVQYISWPIRDDLPDMVKRAIDRWIAAAVATATVDQLFAQYFNKVSCPIGTAGDNCELYCDPNHGKSNVKGVCVCHSVKWTGDDCSIEVPENTNTIPTSFRVTGICLFAINVVIILVCAAWLFRHRNSQQVKYSQPFFLLLVLLGCFVSTSTILAMMQEDDGSSDESKPMHCMAIVWLYSVGFAITFGALSAKILRVYMVFKAGTRFATSSTQAHSSANANSSGQNSQGRRFLNFVSFRDTLLVIGAILLVDIIILAVWSAVDPLEYERTVTRADQLGVPLESQGYCTCDSWKLFGGLIAAFHLTLMLVASYLCYQTRDIPTKYSVSKYVAIAMVSNLQIFAVGLPILFILGDDPQASFFVRSAVIWMNDLAVVLLIFGNLMYSLHFAPPESWSVATVKKELGEAAHRFSARTEGSGSPPGPGLRAFLSPPTAGSGTNKKTKDSHHPPVGTCDNYLSVAPDRAMAPTKGATPVFAMRDSDSHGSQQPMISSLTQADSLPPFPEMAAMPSKAPPLKPERKVSIMEEADEVQFGDKKQALANVWIPGMPERKMSTLEGNEEDSSAATEFDNAIYNPKIDLVKPERKISAHDDPESLFETATSSKPHLDGLFSIAEGSMEASTLGSNSLPQAESARQ